MAPLSVWNFAFRAWASSPFCNVKAARLMTMGPALTASAAERTDTIDTMEGIVWDSCKGVDATERETGVMSVNAD